MTADEARDAIKNRLKIPLTTDTFDDLIEGYVVDSVRRLYPRSALEVESQEVNSFSVDDLGEVVIQMSALPTPIRSARKVEMYDDYTWSTVNDTYHHGNELRLRGLTDNTSNIRIYGLKSFPDITYVYEELLQAIIWWGMSEFYDYLASDKKSYNIYMQVSGARAVDNMADQSAYYDTKANQYVDEQARAYGG